MVRGVHDPRVLHGLGGTWSQGGGIPPCTEADPPREQNDKQV